MKGGEHKEMVSASSKTNHRPATVRKIAKRTVDVLFTILLLLAILLAVYVFQNKKTNGQVRIAGYQLFIVLSGSMSPIFDTGSVIFVKDIAPQDIVVGDIVTFLGAGDTGKTVTHRVIDITSESGDLRFTTKGDANNVTDSSKQVPENVIGKVRCQIPYLGYFLEFSRTKTGIYLLIVLPSLIIFMLEIRKVIGYLLERKKAKKIPIADAKQPESSDERRIESMQQELPRPIEHPIERRFEQPLANTFESSEVRIEKPVTPDSPGTADPASEKDIENKAMNLLSEVQNQSIQEIYKYRIHEERIRKELREKLDQKLKEEEALDRSIRQIREELLRTMEK